MPGRQPEICESPGLSFGHSTNGVCKGVQHQRFKIGRLHSVEEHSATLINNDQRKIEDRLNVVIAGSLQPCSYTLFNSGRIRLVSSPSAGEARNDSVYKASVSATKARESTVLIVEENSYSCPI